jgi:hypothetical protein
MKHTSCVIWFALALVVCGCIGCAQKGEALGDSLPSGAGTNVFLAQNTNQLNNLGQEEAIENMKRTLDAARRHLANPPLPNFVTGPGQPAPIGVNFYSINWHYPAYLLCEYDVSEKHYDASNEPAWFQAALLQIRGYGPDRFPPIRWVAVIISNVAEPGGRNATAENSKVGAIFNAAEVFDRSRSLPELVARTTTDRHPFTFDPRQPTPGEQQRWLIVEQHAATIGAVTNSSERMVTPAPQP